MMSAFIRNRAAVVGVPAALFFLALIVGVASAASGFTHPASFVVACFLAAAGLLLGGAIASLGSAKLFASRRVQVALGAAYFLLGLVSLLVGLVFYGLMNACYTCL
jgi:hypothetical protein